MKGLVLGNIDYRQHTTNEGDQLQMGLVEGGWEIAGYGFSPDNCVDVRVLLDRHQPDFVYIQDVRDWDSRSLGCFDQRCSFTNIEAIREAGVRAATSFKDCWDWYGRVYRDLIDQTGLDIATIYYHERVVTAPNALPWLAQLKLVRTYHTVDREVVERIWARRTSRRRAIVTGAYNDATYPLRKMAFEQARFIGCDIKRHPGYANRGTDTDRYLEILAGYKVSIATASVYGCALRKIIEAVACGAIPVTNLPEWDVLPEIDGALVRIPSDITAAGLRDAVHLAASTWKYEERRHWAERAMARYDYRVEGRRLSEELWQMFASPATS